MGKAKPRHKSRKQRSRQTPNGIQVPSVCDPEEGDENELQSTNNDESVIMNIIDELQSTNVDEKLCGLQSLAMLAGKSEAVEAIVEHKIIKIIGPMLMDKSSEVRNLTAGILRNLSASGSPEVCEKMVKDDVMTPLVALTQQYNDWKPSSDSEDSDTLLQVVNILWNLCETDETALKYFTSANLLNLLLRCVDHNDVGLDLSISACQCLNSVLEDNATVASTLRDHESKLLALLQTAAVTNKHLYFKTLVAGVVASLNPSSQWLPQVLGVLREALTADLRDSLCQLSSALPLSADTELAQDTVDQLTCVTNLTDTQTTALEVLTNLTSGQDEEMDAESEGSLSGGEDDVNGYMETEDAEPLALISAEVSEGLQRHSLVAAVLSLLQPLPENVVDIIRSCPASQALAKKLVRLQCRTFLCLNNLLSVLDVGHFGGCEQLMQLVHSLTTQKLHQFKTDDNGALDVENTELLEALTSAIRAVLLILIKSDFYCKSADMADSLKMFMKLGEFSEPRVQANVFRIVGATGMLLSKDQKSAVRSLITAGDYLLRKAEQELSLWLTAEALDSLMDLFAEDDTDTVACEISLIPRLEALAPRLKTKMRKERKTLGDRYPIVSTVMTNLRPFIKYKSARVNAVLGNNKGIVK